MLDLGYEKNSFGVNYFMADYSGYPCPKSRISIKRWRRKGLTHIGIIRALEENNIPIDYIAGTSMGAIIGSLYAMGYSPDDMVELLKSEDFKRWYSGEVEEKYVYHFKKNLPTPEFFNIRFSFKDSLKNLKPQFLPTSVVNPIQMNLVLLICTHVLQLHVKEILISSSFLSVVLRPMYITSSN